MRPTATILLVATLTASPCSAQVFRSLAGLVISPDGRILAADRGGHRVYAIDPVSGEIAVVAGTGDAGFAGDGGPATAAAFRNPEWLAFDSSGTLWVADRGNARIRAVDSDGVVETRVGGSTSDGRGDVGRATAVDLSSPFGVAAGPDGAVYVFDTEVHTIRRVDPRTRHIATVVGTGMAGNNGDGGPGTSIQLRRPHNGTFDGQGRLVFGDSFNHLIRRWDPVSDRVVTLAGSGMEGIPEVGQLAETADLNYFGAIVVEPSGGVMFTSIADSRVWRIRPDDDRLEVVAGTGEEGFSGDGGPATEARLAFPYGLALGPDGRLYVADSGNRRVRMVDLVSGRIVTIAGS